MRLAFDHQIFEMQYGGVSRYFAHLASILASQPEFVVRVVAPLYLNAYLAEVPAGIVPGQRIAPSRLNRRVARFVNTAAASSLQSRFHPDVVHETYYARRRHAPARARIVVTVYDMIHEKFPGLMADSAQVAAAKAAAIARADHILCISEHTRADLIRIHPNAAEKSSVTLLGFDPSPPIAADFTGRPYLLAVGQRAGYKNFLGLLEAYASAPRLHESFDLVAAGGGRFTDAEASAIHSYGLSEQVRQIQVTDTELRRCYAGASAFVYPSLYEGFGIPPLEAMAAGVPVVAMNVSSIPEICGDAASYAHLNDRDSLREAIERVVLSPSETARLVAKGTARLAHFSWARCADETAAVYRTLV